MLRATLSAILGAVLCCATTLEWLDVPYVRQSRNGCGAAAVAMVMQYWVRNDRSIDPLAADGDRIYSALARPGGKGIAGQDLERYLDDHGFVANIFRGEVGDVRDHLTKGRPLIACLAPRGPDSPLHYVVIAGVTDGHVLFHDPVRGKLIRERLTLFERHWETTGNWVLLATPRQTP